MNLETPKKIYLLWISNGPYPAHSGWSISDNKGLDGYSLNGTSYKLVAEVDVEFDIGGFDPQLATIEGLEAALQKMRADNKVAEDKLHDQIQQLKYIGHEKSYEGDFSEFGDDEPF